MIRCLLVSIPLSVALWCVAFSVLRTAYGLTLNEFAIGCGMTAAVTVLISWAVGALED